MKRSYEAIDALRAGPSPRPLATCLSRIGYAICKKRPAVAADWSILVHARRRRLWRPVSCIDDSAVPATPPTAAAAAEVRSSPQKETRSASENELDSDEELPEWFPREQVQQLVSTGQQMLRSKMQKKIDRILNDHASAVEKLNKQLVELQEENDKLCGIIGELQQEDQAEHDSGNADIFYLHSRSLDRLERNLRGGKDARTGMNSAWRALDDPWMLNPDDEVEAVSLKHIPDFIGVFELKAKVGHERAARLLLQGRRPVELGSRQPTMLAGTWCEELLADDHSAATVQDDADFDL